MKLNHVGIVVEDINEYVTKSMYDKPEEIVFDEIQKANICLLGRNENKIELIEPVDKDSKVFNFLKNHGGGVHHICYEVKTVKQASKSIKENNMIKVMGPVEAKIFNGNQVLFAFDRNKELIEFLVIN